ERAVLAVDDQHRERGQHFQGEVLAVVAGQVVLDDVAGGPGLGGRGRVGGEGGQGRGGRRELGRKRQRHLPFLAQFRLGGRLQFFLALAVDLQVHLVGLLILLLAAELQGSLERHLAVLGSDGPARRDRGQRPVRWIGGPVGGEVDDG